MTSVLSSRLKKARFLRIPIYEETSILYSIGSISYFVLYGLKLELNLSLASGSEIEEFEKEGNWVFFNLSKLRYSVDDNYLSRCPQLRDLFPAMGSRSSRSRTINDVIVFLMHLMITHSPNERATMVDCFRLYWRVLPCPYIRLPEMVRCINEDWIERRSPGYFRERMQNVCSVYMSEFRDMAEGPVGPRSLLDICRHEVRKVAVKFAPNRLKCLDGLGLPKKLVSFLKLEF